MQFVRVGEGKVWKGLSLTMFILLMALLVPDAKPAYGLSAQKQRVTIELISEEPLPLPQGTVRRIVIERDKQAVSGQLIRKDNRLLLSLPGQPPLELPRQMETMVSQDGTTILQYGDGLDLSHPLRTNLFWLDMDGQEINQVMNYYTEKAHVSMSIDGFTAVAGLLFQKPGESSCSLYSPKGDKLWEFSLAEDPRAAKVRVAPGGASVILVTTDNKDWLSNHQIHIIDANGKVSSSVSTLGLIQKLAVVGQGDHLFVQGRGTYGLVRISTGELLWMHSKEIRMISPHGAALSPTGGYLFLLLADWQGRAQKKYRWKLQILDTGEGREVGSTFLPKEYPGTWEQVFELVVEDRIQILAENQRITYSWKKADGGE